MSKEATIYKGNQTQKDQSKRDKKGKKKLRLKVNDSVLGAVQEAQPFEEAADQFKKPGAYYGITKNEVINDVFGCQIQDPDRSNPTRKTDERPLDTIRGFQYSITGDSRILTQLETPIYGFHMRPDFNFNDIATAQKYNQEVHSSEIRKPEIIEYISDEESLESPSKWSWLFLKKPERIHK